MTISIDTQFATFQGPSREPVLATLYEVTSGLGLPGIAAAASAAIDQLEAIADDGVLSASEKVTKLIPLDRELDATWVLLDSRAAALSDTNLPAARQLAAAARGAWLAFRNALFPPWDDAQVDTPVDRVPYDARLEDYRNSLSQLADALRLAAALTANWTGVSDDTGKKPEDNATKGATIGTDLKDIHGEIIDPLAVLNPILALGSDGTLTAVIGGVPQILGTLKLPDLGAASDAARRQLEADMASLSAAIAQLTAGQSIVQNVLRDAGLFTDPASGVAKLFAIESRGDQISKLSVSLNAALSTISLKADVNYVNEQILAAQLPGQAADLSSLLVRVTSAETSINGLSALVQLKADATVVTGLQGTVSAVQTSLDALNATVATKASQTQVDAQGARLSLAEQTLSAIDGASITNSVTASRRAATDSDIAGANDLMSLLGGAQNALVADTAIATARNELGARIAGAYDAIASQSLALGVQIGAVSSSVASEQAARVAGDQASASALASYIATNGANIASINASLISQSNATSALSARLDTYEAVTDASIASAQTSIVTQANNIAAVAGELHTYKASNDGNVAGINQTLTAQSNQLGALTQSLNTYKATTDSSLANLSQQIVTQASAVSALSSRVDTINTTVGGHTATLTTYGQSINGLLLKYGVEFNQDGHVTGFSLNSGNGRTDAVFVVDNFKIAKPNGGTANVVFSVADDGAIEMPNVRVRTLAAQSVTAETISGSAVQRVTVFKLGADISVPAGS